MGKGWECSTKLFRGSKRRVAMIPIKRDVSEPIRVCFVIDRLGIAGTETQLLTLICNLNRAVIRPFLCLLDGNDEQSQTLAPRDCPTVRLGVHSLHRPTTIRAAGRFIRFLRKHRIEIVQTHFADSTYFAAPVAKLAGVRHVLRTRRDLGYWVRPVDRLVARFCNRMTTAVVTNCEACRRAVMEQEGASAESVVVIPNGIDLGGFGSIAPYTPRADRHVRWVGMVANLRPVKGPDVFIRAAAEIAQSHPNVTFQIAGTGDTESAWQLARECGIDDRLQLLGTVRDIPAYLAQLDIAVLPSHSEGLSNALLEYMAAGRPIVATAVGGNVEAIQHEENGLLVPPSNPMAIAEAVNRLFREEAFAAALAAAAQSAARERYSLETMVQRHEGLYRDIVASSRFGNAP